MKGKMQEVFEEQCYNDILAMNASITYSMRMVRLSKTIRQIASES